VRIFLGLAGTLCVVAGLAVLVWPGFHRLNDLNNRTTQRIAWMRRAEERRVGQLKAWSSRPTPLWFVPVLVAGILLAFFLWLASATALGSAGPGFGLVMGLLLLYGFARRPGSTLGTAATQARMAKWAMIGGAWLALGAGIIMLLLGAGAIES
jgi:membrane associated rhomboid family serine protease